MPGKRSKMATFANTETCDQLFSFFNTIFGVNIRISQQFYTLYVDLRSKIYDTSKLQSLGSAPKLLLLQISRHAINYFRFLIPFLEWTLDFLRNSTCCTCICAVKSITHRNCKALSQDADEWEALQNRYIYNYRTSRRRHLITLMTLLAWWWCPLDFISPSKLYSSLFNLHQGICGSKRNRFLESKITSRRRWQVLYLEEVYLVTALVPSETACLANSPGRRRRTAVWISREVMVDLLL